MEDYIAYLMRLTPSGFDNVEMFRNRFSLHKESSLILLMDGIGREVSRAKEYDSAKKPTPIFNADMEAIELISDMLKKGEALEHIQDTIRDKYIITQ